MRKKHGKTSVRVENRIISVIEFNLSYYESVTIKSRINQEKRPILLTLVVCPLLSTVLSLPTIHAVGKPLVAILNFRQMV